MVKFPVIMKQSMGAKPYRELLALSFFYAAAS